MNILQKKLIDNRYFKQTAMSKKFDAIKTCTCIF